MSVRIAQRILREDSEEMCESLHVKCEELEDGTLVVEVLIFHPDWDEPLRIASIQSKPSDTNPGTTIFQCDLEHRHL